MPFTLKLRLQDHLVGYDVITSDFPSYYTAPMSCYTGREIQVQQRGWTWTFLQRKVWEEKHTAQQVTLEIRSRTHPEEKTRILYRIPYSLLYWTLPPVPSRDYTAPTKIYEVATWFYREVMTRLYTQETLKCPSICTANPQPFYLICPTIT